VVAEFLQPAKLVPVTVYVVVEAGLAFAESHVAQFKPDEGNHWYEGAPFALSAKLSPAHIAGVGGTTVTVGVIFTVIKALSFVLHPPVPFPVTIYSVVAVGVATTVEPIVVFNPAGGAHE
jgi:hypothetical protein